MSTTTKAILLAQLLQQDLKKRLAKTSTAYTVAEVSQDTDQCPLIQIGTGVAGDAGGMVKVKPYQWPLVTDVVGIPRPDAYALTTIQFVREATVTPNTLELTACILSALAARGCVQEFYESTNGTAPDSSQFIAGNLVYTHTPDADFGFGSSQ